MRLKFKRVPLSFGICALLIGGGATAAMQHYSPPPRATVGAAAKQGAQLSPQTVAKFKRAYHSVRSIEKEYTTKMRNAHGSKAMESVRKWARTKMVDAVKAAGLTVSKYNHVMMLVQRNTALRKQILGH